MADLVACMQAVADIQDCEPEPTLRLTWGLDEIILPECDLVHRRLAAPRATLRHGAASRSHQAGRPKLQLRCSHDRPARTVHPVRTHNAAGWPGVMGRIPLLRFDELCLTGGNYDVEAG
jgi:hypothetical protein